MNTNLIYSNGRQCARNPVAPLFPKLVVKSLWSDVDKYHCDGCNSGELYASQMWTATLCAKCEKKRKEKECTSRAVSTSQTNSQSTSGGVTPTVSDNGAGTNSKTVSGSAPEFKIGDLVECLPFERWANGQIPIGSVFGKVGKIIWSGCITAEPSVVIDTHSDCHPLRALRHAETEPQAKDGWRCIQRAPQTIFAMFRNDDGKKVQHESVGWHAYGTLLGLSVGKEYKTWIDLKRAIEKYQKVNPK